MTVNELLSGLKKATGPDRELDREIGFLICGWTTFRHLTHVVMLQTKDGAFLDDPDSLYPAFTESLGDAFTLVPKEYDWIIARTNGGLTIHACVGDTKEHFGETPALALCIAAIEAHRKAKEPT